MAPPCRSSLGKALGVQINVFSFFKNKNKNKNENKNKKTKW